MIERACLYLVYEPLLLCEEATVEVGGLDVVDGKGNLLILVELQEVVVLKVCFLLSLDDPSHQLYRRIVLSAIFASLRLHHHLAELLGVRLELHVEHGRCRCRHVDGLRLISHSTEGQLPSVVAWYGVGSHGIAAHGYMVSPV